MWSHAESLTPVLVCFLDISIFDLLERIHISLFELQEADDDRDRDAQRTPGRGRGQAEDGGAEDQEEDADADHRAGDVPGRR